jgi:oxaloacetate decarboxylase alpha subunit
MLPVAGKLDAIGYWSLEMWGGATFDTCLRYLREDPWERLRLLRKAMPNTRMQMLLRGQNLLGYKHYADDVVDLFVRKAVDNGIDVFRIFDALNDTRNMKRAIDAVNACGGHVEGCMSYTISPVHTLEYFVDLAVELEEMGSKTICIKDMACLLLPYDAYKLIKMLKERVKVPIHLHTHNTTGTGNMTLLKAVEAGVDIVDTSLSPLGDGTAQPSTEPFVKTLEGTEYDTGLDVDALAEIADHFRAVAARLEKEGSLDTGKVMRPDIRTLLYQVPGGMYSNLIKQLEDQGSGGRLHEVLSEVPRVREDFGYPPLVTPTSQIVGTQAVINVLSGQRYKMFTKESKALLRGEYGKLPAEPNPDVVKLALGEEPRITCRPADDIPPELDKYRKELGEYIEQEEDVLSYALFPQVAMDYFKYRRAAKYGIDATLYREESGVHPI